MKSDSYILKQKACRTVLASYVFPSGLDHFWEDAAFAAIVSDAAGLLAQSNYPDLRVPRAVVDIFASGAPTKETHPETMPFELEFWRLFQAIAEFKDPLLIIHLAYALDHSDSVKLANIETMLFYLIGDIPQEISDRDLRAQWCRSLIRYLDWVGTRIPQIMFSHKDIQEPRFFYQLNYKKIFADVRPNSRYLELPVSI